MFKKKIFVGLLLCVLAVGALVSYYPDVQAQEVNSLPNRLAGQDLFQTAKVIGEEFNSGEATNVILASGIDFLRCAFSKYAVQETQCTNSTS